MLLSRRVLSRFYATDLLIYGILILSVGACSRSPSVEPRPAVVALSGQSGLHSTVDGGLVRFPGVDLGPLDHGAFIVRIHSGMVGDGSPLYVIDGQPMVLAPNRGIDWLKPEDISGITVVKNPAELAIYGPRGVNGVIVITTKHGARSRF